MKYATIKEIFLEMNTIAAPLFEGKTYPWEVLAEIGDFIKKIGPTPSLVSAHASAARISSLSVYNVILVVGNPLVSRVLPPHNEMHSAAIPLFAQYSPNAAVSI